MPRFNLTVDEDARERGFTLLSSFMRVDGPYLNQAELCELAARAWSEMNETIREDGISKRGIPTAITILQWRDQIHVSSSVKGGGSSSWIDQTMPDNETFNLLRKALQESGIDPPASHRNQASCGEMLTLHQWSIRNAATSFESLCSGKDCLIVTVGKEGQAEQKVLTVKKPCYGTPNGGCQRVLEYLGLRPLSQFVEPNIHFPTPEINLVDHNHVGIFG